MGRKNNVPNETYTPTHDELIRLSALDRALQNVPTGAPSEIVLQRAKAYEDYLRNADQEKSIDSPFVSEASEATKNVVNRRGMNDSDRVRQAELMDAEKINRTVWNSAIDAVFALGGDRSNRETFDLGTIRNAVKGLYRR